MGKEELKSLGFVMTDSKANFIFARHPGYDAGTLFEEPESRAYLCPSLG